MTLLAFGINHKTASLETREHVSFTADIALSALYELKMTGHVLEAAILSTCNRTEIYCTTKDTEAVISWFAKNRQISLSLLDNCLYLYEEASAVAHMMRVACGLDSMLLGESQILGQLKQCYGLARRAGTIGKELDRLFQMTFALAKQVRSETGIAVNPVSVAYAAVKLSTRIFTSLPDATVLLIGAGDTMELAARHLAAQGVKRFIVANRTYEKAKKLAARYEGEAILLQQLPDYLSKADLLFTATNSVLPLIGKGSIERALKERRHRPMFMVDLAMPRNIEPQVAQLEDAYLYTLEDLRRVVDENVASRHIAAQEAEVIITHYSEDYMIWRRSLQAVGSICGYRDSAIQIRDQQIEKALQQLAQGASAPLVLSKLAHSLTNKLLHAPTIALRTAAEHDEQILSLLSQSLLKSGD